MAFWATVAIVYGVGVAWPKLVSQGQAPLNWAWPLATVKKLVDKLKGQE